MRPAMRTATGIGVCLIGVLSLAFYAAVQLHVHRVIALGWRTFPVAEFTSYEGHAYSAQLRDGWLSSRNSPTPAQILEDGVPLASGNCTHESIRESGQGRYSFWDTSVVFSASDNSDPRVNGRRYAIHAPIRISHWLQRVLFLNAVIWGVLLVVVLPNVVIPALRTQYGWLGERLSGGIVRVFGSGSFATACAVFAAALTVQLINFAVNFRDPSLAETGFSIFGAPYTDARGWHEMGKSIALGQGLHNTWPAMRPGYGIFLAMFYVWTGGSYVLAALLNVVLTALTTALIFRLGEQIQGRWVGILSATGFLLIRNTYLYPLTLASEPLGLFGCVYGLQLLLCGMESRNWRTFAAAGLFFGISNLARPLTLPGCPLIALTVLACLMRSCGWKGAIGRTAAFTVGVTVIVAPWLLRQWLAFGFVTISDNSADNLYCATSPKYGYWTNQIYREPDYHPANPREKYAHFMAKTKDNLREHPDFYAQNVRICFLQCLRNTSETLRGNFSQLGLAIFAGAFAVGTLSVRGLRQSLILAALFGAAGYLFSSACRTKGIGLDVVALLLLPFVCRPAVSTVFLVVALSSVFGIAMFGMDGRDPRMLYMIQWYFILAELASLGGCCSWMLRRIAASPAPVADTVPAASPRWFVYGYSLVASAALLTLGWLAILTTQTTVPEPRAQMLSPEEGLRILRDFDQYHPNLLPAEDISTDKLRCTRDPDAWFSASKDKLVLFPVRIHEPTYQLPKDVVLPHWSRNFLPRTYDRTLCFFQFDGVPFPKNCNFHIPAMYSGYVPEDYIHRDCFVLCRVRYEPKHGDTDEDSIFEGIAIIPRNADKTPNYSAAYISKDPAHAPAAGMLTAGQARR